MTNLNLIIAGGQLIGKWKQPNTNLQKRSDFMSNCHVKGNLAAGSVKLNDRQRLNMAMAFVTYVLRLEVYKRKGVFLDVNFESEDTGHFFQRKGKANGAACFPWSPILSPIWSAFSHHGDWGGCCGVWVSADTRLRLTFSLLSREKACALQSWGMSLHFMLSSAFARPRRVPGT